MLPEGLQHSSIEDIVSKIKDAGLNAIRLTYATQMIDQMMDNFEQDITLEQAFEWALGPKNGSEILEQVSLGEKIEPRFMRLTAVSIQGS